MSHKLKFRPEINGLRAIAVIMVIVFHLNEQWLPMGYLGVDIFFVISGFLITRIILKEIEKREFSLSEFITRRIKRIFPALFVVLFCSAILAVFIFSSDDHRSFFRSLRYASFQCANFFFEGDAGYFDVASKFKPLLHTWSLGVEEQFYVVWPLLLCLAAKLKCNRVFLFFLVIISSFAIMWHYQQQESLKAFYMFYSRAWEFSVGGFMALGILKGPKSKAGSNIIASISLVGVFLPMFFSPGENSNDMLWLVITSLSVCGIIYSSQNETTFVAKSLSLSPLLYIGLLSYSLYLWHWPLIVYYNYLKDIYFVSIGELETQSLGWIGALVIIFLCWLLSAITHKWVENPCRNIKLSNKKTIVSALLLIASFTLFAKSLQKQSDSSWRVSSYSDTVRLKDLKIDVHKTYDSEPSAVVLIGDSHAEHFFPLIEQWAKNAGLEAKSLHRGGTPPFVGQEHNYPSLSIREKKHHTRVKQYILDNPQVQHVIISAAHASYNTSPQYEKALEQTIQFLYSKGKNVCLITQTPPLNSSFLKYLELPHLMEWLFPKQLSNEDILAFDKEFTRNQLQPMRELSERLQKTFPQLHVWHPEDHLKSGIHEGIPCYYDATHLNKHGALYFLPYFDYPINPEL